MTAHYAICLRHNKQSARLAKAGLQRIYLTNKFNEAFYFHQIGEGHWRLFIESLGYLRIGSYKKVEDLLSIPSDIIKEREFYITIDGRRIYLHAIITFNILNETSNNLQELFIN